MTGPVPAVAATRSAVRSVLADFPTERVVVAVSGGADSLALLAATVFEARSPRNGLGLSVVGATVDHGLQEGSETVAARVVGQMADLGVDETATIRVHVDVAAGGLEAGAREARYAALQEFATRIGAGLVLLGHTRDDQAETVLMGLARGSGGRSLSGMRAGFTSGEVRFARPFLAITRAQTEAACQDAALEWWEDPQNRDQRFLRARIRHVVMPLLEAELGPGLADALARTAPALRADMDLLDDLAHDWWSEHRTLEVTALEAAPQALRTRILRAAAVAAGARDSELTRAHVLAMEALITDWHGQQHIDLPGPMRAQRIAGHIEFVRPPQNL